MGYYTQYSLEWKVLNGEIVRSSCEHEKPNDANFCPVCGKLPKITIDTLISQYIEDNSEKLYGINSDGNATDSVKWRNHEEDIKEMSKNFLDILFTLNGEGEEPDNIWKKYFLNGKMQIVKAQIVFDDFDEGKLK